MSKHKPDAYALTDSGLHCFALKKYRVSDK